MGFGEVALLLGTKRTATIRCITPCEVFMLSRDQYASMLQSLSSESNARKSGNLRDVIDKFWELCTGPDGSRRLSVDFSTYLKLHIRVAKL